MLSRVFNTTFCGLFKSQPSILSNSFTFCTSTRQRHESHPLRNKIMSLSSFDQFTNFFKDKKQQFDPSCYSMASRTLAKILIESKLYFTFQHRQAIKNYLTHLQKIDIEALNMQEFSQLLYLLRIIKLDPNNTTTFVSQFVRAILQRSDSKLKQLELDTSLSRLSYFYQQYSSLGGRQASTLARRINNLLHNNNSQVEFQHLTVNQINLILKGMRSKTQISNDENLLLKNIIKTVHQKYFDKLSFFELAQISVGINQIQFINPSDISTSNSVQQIHKKVLSNIDQMDEKSIMYILNGKKTVNRTYNQIYRVIFQKIVDEIQPNGQSSFNELFTLRLFNGISDKVKLKSTTSENQQKFFAFFRVTITKTPRFIHNFLESYIQKGFFTYKHLIRIQQLLQSIPDFHYRLTLLHELANRRVNVEKLISVEKLKDLEMKDKGLIMMTSILQSLAQKDGVANEKYVQLVAKLKDRFFQLYKVQDDTFSKLVFGLEPSLLITLHKIFRKEIESKLPNPFESQQSQKYKAGWLKLLVHGCPQQVFITKYSNLLKQKLVAKDFQNLIRSMSIQGYSNTDSLSNFLALIGKRFDLFASSDQLLNNLSRLLYSEINKVFQDNASQSIKSRYWLILNESLQKLQPTKFFDTFGPLISNILKTNSYQFRYSTQYHNFLTKLFLKSQFIRSKYMMHDLIDQCLKLNLIKRQHLQSISQKVRDNASNNHKLLLKMIQTNQFALQGVQPAKNNLHLFMFNLSPQTSTYLNKNQDKITALIEQFKPRQAWRSITHYRLGSRKNQVFIIDLLFKQMNKYTLLFEQFSPVFAAQILRRNNFDKYVVKMDNAKIFFKNSLDYFIQRRNLHKLPLQDHVQLIKSLNDFKIRNDDYVHAVFDKFNNDINIWKRQLYLVAGNLGLELNPKEIQRLIQQNFFTSFHASFSKCLNIFLLFEKQLPNPGTHLKFIINKYNEKKNKQKVPVYALHYEYLKKNYPEETKDWQPNHIEKADFCRSLESLHSKSFIALRQTIEQATGLKWIENVICGNYYYTFRNIAIAFPHQSKYYGQNNMMKRLISSLTGIEKVVLLNRRQTHTKSAVKFISQGSTGIFTSAEQQNILKKIDQKYEQYKLSLEEQEHEQAVAEPVVAEQPVATQGEQVKN